MSFPRYERYRESGVEWLGEVPAHWEMAPLRRVGQEREEANTGLVEDNLLSLSYGRIICKDIETLDGLLPDSFETYQIVRPGNIVFRLTDLQNDKRSLRTAIVLEQGIITFAYVAFKPEHVHPAYLNYLLRDYDLRKIFYSMGGGVRQSMKYEDIRGIPILLPHPEEQTLIAAFLDRETAKIDALIEEQRRLIALLKEKRQAVISHALAAKAHAHERTLPLKRVVLGIEQGWSPQCDNFPAEEQEWGVLKVGAVNSGLLNPRDNKRLPAEFDPPPALAIRKGDILISRANTLQLVGSASVAEEDFPHRLLCDKLYRIRTKADVCEPAYLTLLLRTPTVRTLMERAATGASQSMQNIGQDVVMNLPITLPTIKEQRDRLAALDSRQHAIDRLLRSAELATKLLRERRSALISAAVTGKMDVRAYAAKPVASVKPYNAAFARQVLGGEILSRCNDAHMGRTKLQKLIYLTEHHAQLSEIQGEYTREVAGPLDMKAMRGLARGLERQHWFREEKQDGRFRYVPLDKHGQHAKYLQRWADRQAHIDEVLALLGPATMRQCELVATLYAAWNDLLLDGEDATDEAILHQASTAEGWNASKERTAREKWEKALGWMKRKGLVPTGWGSHTRMPSKREAYEPA